MNRIQLFPLQSLILSRRRERNQFSGICHKAIPSLDFITYQINELRWWSYESLKSAIWVRLRTETNHWFYQVSMKLRKEKNPEVFEWKEISNEEKKQNVDK